MKIHLLKRLASASRRTSTSLLLKAATIAAALISFLAPTAHCRIGETLEQLTARFGPGTKNVALIRMPGHDQYYFEKDGIGINCVMSDGTCVMEVIHRIGSMITDEDIAGLISAEKGGHEWKFTERWNRWIRSDYRLQAYRQIRHEDMFFIEEIPSEATANGGKPGF